MRYIYGADTDIGIAKSTNQDSVLVKHGLVNGTEILMAVVCDGMGGLSNGELASATVIRGFERWFRERLPYELVQPDLRVISDRWVLLLKELNSQILQFASMAHLSMGTTFTGVLFLGNEFVVAHVGDSRLYYINDGVYQMTEDHTFIAREIRRGNMTPEQAQMDRRRNMLIQCIGAAERVEPQTYTGSVQQGVYMICSDGFRHVITEDEIRNALHPSILTSSDVIKNNIRYLIEIDKQRQERDNISAIAIKAFE